MARIAADRMVGGPATVALYVHELAHTGVVRNTLAVARALADDGHRVQIITALPGGAVPDGVEHLSLLRGAMRRRRIEQLSVIPALRRYLRRTKPDISISMGNHSHAVMWVAAAGLRDTARVYRISNDLARTMTGAPRGGALKQWLRRRFAGLLVESSDALVLVSPSLLDDPSFAAAHADGKAVVIANGVDIDTARRRALGPSQHPWLDDNQPKILAIGRLAAQKNLPNLLQAIARLKDRIPARLIILGESRDAARAELIAEAERLGIGQQLLLPGTTDNVFAWLARADVFALPSWWEGSPNVLLEAMAVGTPVVASRTAGNAADIVGENAGYLVDPADPDAIASALARQLDPATRIVPGDRVNDFDLGNMLLAWRAFVRDLLGKRQRPPASALPAPVLSDDRACNKQEGQQPEAEQPAALLGLCRPQR